MPAHKQDRQQYYSDNGIFVSSKYCCCQNWWLSVHGRYSIFRLQNPVNYDLLYNLKIPIEYKFIIHPYTSNERIFFYRNNDNQIQ